MFSFSRSNVKMEKGTEWLDKIFDDKFKNFLDACLLFF